MFNFQFLNWQKTIVLMGVFDALPITSAFFVGAIFLVTATDVLWEKCNKFVIF
jgi:hypothetical protein